MSRKRERGANYTAEEKTLLADLVMQYKHVIEDKRSGGIFLNKKKEAWKVVTVKYNSNCTTGRRETEQLKALYDNMKQKTRKKVGESNKIDYLNRKHHMQQEISEEDLAKALNNIKEDKIQINKTGGGFYKPKTTDSDTKILAIIQDQVKPLANPFDSGAIYFKDQQIYDAVQIVEDRANDIDESVEIVDDITTHITYCPPSLPSTSFTITQEQLVDETVTDYLAAITQIPPTLSTTAQESTVAQTGTDQNKTLSKKLRIKKNSKTVPPKKLKRNTSAEALKRNYFKKKCENASLERKKLGLEILYMKQEHNLKMAILKKQLQTNS